MKQKNIFLVILLIAVVAVGVFALYGNVFAPHWDVKPAQIIIQDKQITDNTKPFVIKISYPQIAGLDDFNQKAKAIVDKEITDFKTNSLANDEAVKQNDPSGYAEFPREYELDISYDQGEIDNNIVSVVFNVYSFEGGAHGSSYFVPLNYNPKLKTEIKLADLFINQKDYLQKISTFCVADLTNQITKYLGNTDGTWIQTGAGPTEENYHFFLINKGNLVFYFPQYQVAFGAAGDFKVTIPR